MLRIAAGLTHATEGSVSVPTDHIGYVFQDPTLLPWRSVQSNVELLGELRRLPKDERRRRADAAIKLVGLDGFTQHRPRTLSGGMRMRVSLARSLTLQPELFLLDEPFGTLDEITRQRLNDRLSLASASSGVTWRPGGSASRRPGGPTAGARRCAELEAVRQRAAELFAEGRSAATVADELNVAKGTAVSWQARWRTGGAAALRSRGPSRRPAVPDSQLPAIEQALRQGAAAHGFDSDVWTITRVRVVIQRLTGVQVGRRTVARLLHERLGWSVQQASRAAADGSTDEPAGRRRGGRRGRRAPSVDGVLARTLSCC
jgi:transposase